MGVLLILCYDICYFYFYQLTLSVSVWWWSCDSLHGSRWWGCSGDGV